MQTAPAVRTARRTLATAAWAVLALSRVEGIVATRARLVTLAAGTRLAVRFVARVAGLTAILVVRSRAPIVAGFAALRRSVGLGMRNRFGGLDVGRLFRARRGDGFAQLRKNFLEHDGS